MFALRAVLCVLPLLALAAAEYDHQAHAVPGEEQTVYENPPGSGKAVVKLDGTSSHSHYFDEGPPVVQGKIVSYVWTDAETDKVLGREDVLKTSFDVGTTKVKLTVKDQTGDVASATTKVTVVAAMRYLPGAMLYYYKEKTEKQYASSYPRPYFSRWRRSIDVWDHNDIPKEVRALKDTKAIRLITQFKPDRTGGYEFMLKYMGGGCSVWVNGKKVGSGFADKEGVEKIMRFTENTTKGDHLYIEILLNRRYYPTRLVLYNNAKKTDTLPATEQGVTKPEQISFEPRHVVPITMYSSRASSTTDGGEDIKVRVSGLDGAGDVAVWIECKKDKKLARKIDITKLDASTHMVRGRAPEFPEACEAELYTTTSRKGESNRLPYRILSTDQIGVSGGRAGAVRFTSSTLQTKDGKPFDIPAATSIAYGPDGRFYVGTLTGVIHVLTVDSKTSKVTSSCKSARVAKKGSILGLAFNPLEEYSSNSATLYMSVSVLYFDSKSTGYPWNNGQIVAWKSVNDNRCMIFDRTVITGLPVSDRDHGVNAITFDYKNNLYISVGSFTNGGVKSKQFGNIPEAYLSAAILVADLGKGDFDGDVTYESNEITSKMKSGDVKVYATGVRNSFGMTYHSKHGLYATDNGMNQAFGETSTSCTESTPTKKTQRDKLIRVVKGKYYGFPNRVRNECKFEAEKGALFTMPAATTGVVEYSSNAFEGRLRGQLFLTKFAVQNGGFTSRVVLSKDGEKLADGPTKVLDVSGVGVVVSADGGLYMPQVMQGRVRVLQPVQHMVGLRVLGIVPRIGSKKGGNIITVIGNGFKQGAEVKVGGKKCGETEFINETKMKCVAPNGNGEADVVVTVDGQTTVSYGGEYIYA